MDAFAEDYPYDIGSNPMDWPNPVDKKKIRPQIQEDIYESTEQDIADDDDDDTLLFGMISCF